jgi:hypothetical protein
MKLAGRCAAVSLLTFAIVVCSIQPRLWARGAQTLRQPRAAAGISGQALAQIEALLAEKESRTPGQRKMDSQLIYASRAAAGRPAAAGVAVLDTYAPRTADGRAEVDITANVSPALLARLRALGAEIVDSQAAYRHVGARVPFDRIEAIAALPDVSFVAPHVQALTRSFGGAAGGAGPDGFRSIDSRATRRLPQRASLQQALTVQGGFANTGSVTTEGDAAHRASDSRASFGVDGTGVKIGVLSDGVDGLAASQASGNLPSPASGRMTVVTGQAGKGNEGTAILEIVYDLAPGASLFYATAFTSNTSFAANIRTLHDTYGCDIIIDDVGYFSETPFQDGQASDVISPTNGGVIAQAVKDVVASGALYFAAAGNEGNLDAGTSGTWEGMFVDGGAVTAPIAATDTGTVHDFGHGLTYDVLTDTGFANTLHWADPLGASTNDYDLFLLDSTGTSVVASSTNLQTGSQDPYEFVAAGSPGQRIVIVKRPGAAPRFLHLSAWRGRYSIATAGEIHGHQAVSSANAFGVAATPAPAAYGGPYPNPFMSTDLVERYSSDGPRRIFFDRSGTPLNGATGILLNKPDITAADCVTTAARGFSPFCGTSAAAPHAGAIAALVKSHDASMPAAAVSAALTSTAVDIQSAGVDRDSGYGIVMAYPAVLSVAAPSPPVITSNPASSLTVLTGQVIFLATAAMGVPTPTAQWQVSVNGGASWSNIPGATGPNLSFTAQRADDGRQYRAVYTNASGSAPTTAASVLVRLRVRTDLDNDRRAELMVWRPGDGTWYWLYSGSDYLYANGACKAWGSGALDDVPLSGDMDGDGRADLVVWRPSSGVFYWLTSTTGYDYAASHAVQWGSRALNDVPLLGDIDGDGKADLIIWRPSTGTFYYLLSSTGYDPGLAGARQWGSGALGDIPMIGDFDGDGLADLAVWRASTGTFFWLTSSSGYSYNSAGQKQWGDAALGDVPLVGDIDGDGVTDLVVWRRSTGTFFWITAISGFSYESQGSKQWGDSALGDVPMLGDIDGDGIDDLVIWRDTDGTWYWLLSSGSYSYDSQGERPWGTSGDKPVIK